MHYLSPGVTTHSTEGIITEDDGTVLHLCVSDDKLSILGGKEKREKKGVERQAFELYNNMNKNTQSVHRVQG